MSNNKSILQTIKYRMSVESDKNIIDQLLIQCFGDRSGSGALDDLDNRYLLAFNNQNQLIAMTGIAQGEYSQFNGYEVDWTCCSHSYRKQGIITNMLSTLLKDFIEDVYCSAWHYSKDCNANLHSILTKLNFKLIVPRYKVFFKQHVKQCDYCTQCQGNDCCCVEDLYIRPEMNDV